MSTEAEESIAFARDQLERGVAAVGALHPDAIQARLHLGIVLSQTGFSDMALDEFSHAARDACASFGPLHPDALIARYHEMTALIQSGRPQEAAPGLEGLLADHLEVFGPQHVGTFSVRSALANVLIALGRHEEADEQLAMLLLEVDESGLELERGQRASWLLQRSHCLSDPLRFKDAVELARQAKRAVEDPHTGSLAIRVAAQARALDALALAVMPNRDRLGEDALHALLDEVRRELELLREDLGSAAGDPELAQGSMHWINSRISELSGALLVEDPETVLPAMRSLVDELTMLRGLDVATMTAASRLGELLGESGRVEDAVGFLEGIVTAVEEAGSAHTSVGLILRNNLGQWMANAGRLSEALPVLRAAVDDAMLSPHASRAEREITVRNLIDRASMLGDLETTRYATDLLDAMARGSSAADPISEPDGLAGRAAPSVTAAASTRAIDLLAAGAAPQSARAVANAVAACARLGRPVLIERHEDGWCWSLAAPSIEELASTLRSLDAESEDLPAFVLASAWVVRDGLTSWRPRPAAARATEWWLVPLSALGNTGAVMAMIGGAR